MFNSPATAVFAPLARFPPEDLPAVVRRMEEVISAQTDPTALEHFWSVAYSSMGLRYSAERVNELLSHVLPRIYRHQDARGVLSDGYFAGQSAGQMEGPLEITRRWILMLGSRRLPEPPPSFRETLATIQSLERLEQIAARIRKATTWQEALALQ